MFLSYASQDAEAAQRICAALRAAGIEVWFDQSALRGGDVWDQTIRRQIKTCVLFIPVISRHTHERDEGYFRLEWKLAVDRSHLMTSHKAFLLPVVIDDTREDDENVPDRFKDIHWTRLPAGETPPAFIERVRRLVSPEASREATPMPQPGGVPPSSATAAMRGRAPGSSRAKRALPAIVAVVVVAALAYFAIDRLWVAKHPGSPPPAAAAVGPTAFAPPPHSIAVLPFINMSGDKEQDYFSDGLTEELLNSLSRINELQVAARTSAFSFKGKDVKIGTIARELNVAAVLEGSVRRSGHTVRITAQLINAVTGFHLWSETYDRDLGDVLKLQSDIANAVAGALKLSLLGDTAAKIELGGTRNAAALDAFLRGSKAYWGAFTDNETAESEKNRQAAIAGFTEAIRLDPDYALAYANRSIALSGYAGDARGLWPLASTLKKAQADARRAIALTPDLGEGHLALAVVFNDSLNFIAASQEYERALALAPGNARLLRDYGLFAAYMGRAEAGLAAARRSVVLDPLNYLNHLMLGQSLVLARRYDEAVAALTEARTLDPKYVDSNAWLGFAYYALGNFQSARADCEGADEEGGWFCLAVTYDKLGRHPDAEKMLAKLRASQGDTAATQFAMIYAQWGDTKRALDWLETAMRLHSSDMLSVKTAFPYDPLRKEPRFQAIERELRFPSE